MMVTLPVNIIMYSDILYYVPTIICIINHTISSKFVNTIKNLKI